MAKIREGNENNTGFAQKLLDWYWVSRRYLPWREDPTPYHVLLSEIMLQQTRVETALPYYLVFLKAFPRLEDLAMAEEEEVVRLWQGLGYYSRARNLHRLAKKVVECFDGKVPDTEEALRSLPGVGPYVSHAVLAIAFGQSYVAVDGNLIRVYSRLAADPVVANGENAKKKAEAFYLDHLADPSAFNQALMDLGELVCLPHGTPHCDSCPFSSDCLAHQEENELGYPLPKKKKQARHEKRAVYLVFHHGKVATLRRDDGLLGGMDEFPNALLGETFPGVSSAEKVGHYVHRFSHIAWDVDVFFAEGEVEGARYVGLDEIKTVCALPTAFLKALSFLPPGGDHQVPQDGGDGEGDADEEDVP